MNFSELNRFSLSKKNIQSFHVLKLGKKIVKHETPVKQIVNESLFFPAYKDSLFWCYYIIIYGIEDFRLIQSDFKEEKNIKINLIQKIREKKQILKKMKYKRTEIEDELLNQHTISPTTFTFLCFLKQQNIIIKSGILYTETINDPENPTIFFIEKKNNKYGIYLTDVQKQINLCIENNMKVDNIDKPMRPLSYYKLNDLQEICKKLQIGIMKKTKKIKKKDLYQLINLKIKN